MPGPYHRQTSGCGRQPAPDDGACQRYESPFLLQACRKHHKPPLSLRPVHKEHSTTPEVKPTLESTSGNVENLLSQILSELVKSNTNLATISEGQASFKSLETTLQSGFTTMSNYLAQLPSSSSSYVETDPASINRTQSKPTQTSKKEMKSRIPISPTKPALNVSKTRRQAANTTNSTVV